MTPDEAIHAQEVQHMRVFVYFVIALSVLCVGAVIGLGGASRAWSCASARRSRSSAPCGSRTG
jgi:hypothetical protein